jgi:hypothetical protein
METRPSIRGIDRVLKELVNPSSVGSFAAQLERAQSIAGAASDRRLPGVPSAAILQRAAIMDVMLRKLSATSRPPPRRSTVQMFDPA